jgi:hypothetical protein
MVAPSLGSRGHRISWAKAGEIPAGLLRTAVMSSQLIGLVVAAIGCIIAITVAVGLPALAIVAVRFFKFKERELTLEMEYRQKSQETELALEQQVQGVEQRVRNLEAGLSEMHARLGIDQPATPMASRPDFLEGPAPDAQREQSLDPSRTKAR